MKKAFFLLIFMLTVLMLSEAEAQKQGQKKIDSLFSVLKTAKEDTSKVNTLNALANEFANNNPDTAVYFAKEALKLARKLNYKIGVADAHNTLGIGLRYLGKYEEALKNHYDALKIFDELLSSAAPGFISKILNGKGKSYNGIGNVKNVQGDYPEGLKNFFSALRIYQETNDKNGCAKVYNNIGSIYTDQGNYVEALKNYFAGLKLNEELGNKQNKAYYLTNIGRVYQGQGNDTDALNNYLAALKINEETGNKRQQAGNLTNIGSIYTGHGNFVEALKTFFTALKLNEELGNKQWIVTNLTNIGTVYDSQGKYVEALKNYFASLKISQEIGDKDQIAICFNNIGNDYINLKNYREASRYLTKALSLSKEIGRIETIKYTYEHLSKLASLQGNFKQSLEHYKMYIIYRDSLINKETTKKTMQIQMQYEFDKKESLAKAEQDKKDAIAMNELQHQRKMRVIYYVIAGVFFLLIVIGMLRRFRYRRRRDKEQLTTEFKKKLAEAETKALRAQMNPHFIFNCLNSINSFVIDQQHEIASEYLIKFSKLIRLILDNSRSETISIEKELETLKLYVFLESARFDNKFKCEYYIAENVNTNSVMIPPMLLQPFVENAIWHGLMQKATEGTITIEIKKENEEFLNISITDDGIGREKATELKSKSATHKSHGLKVTSQRIEMMNKLNSTGAKVQIYDLKDEQDHASGTKVELIIPF